MPVTRGLGVLLVGPPGSGRRTQGYRLSETLGVCNINVSALVHAAMKAKHPHVMHVLSSGEKLSDQVIIEEIMMRITSKECSKGFVLHGYPQTMQQAEAFVEDLSPNVTHIIKLNIEEEEQLLERLGILESLHAIKIWTEERLVHKLSGRSYHPKFNPSQAELKDDVTGETLIRMSQDFSDSIKKRLVAYNSKFDSVLNYLFAKLETRKCEINAAQDIEIVHAEILKCFDVS